MLCCKCHRPIPASLDICTCGVVANRDKRRRKHGKSGKVHLRRHGRGETPDGRFMSVSVGEETVSLHRRKGEITRTYLGSVGAKRGLFVVIHDTPKGPRLVCSTDICKQARDSFQSVRCQMLAAIQTKPIRRVLLLRAAARYAKQAHLNPLSITA